MQFQIPQFETEDKLVGPFTIVQFMYVGVSAIISFILFPILTTWFWFAISSFLVGTSLIIALMKVNGRPMPIFMVAAFRYLWEPRVLMLKPNLPVGGEEAVGLRHISPLPPSKKFEVPRQMSVAAELAMSPSLAHKPAETEISIESSAVIVPSIKPVEDSASPAALSMPAPLESIKSDPSVTAAILPAATPIPVPPLKIPDAPVIRQSAEFEIADVSVVTEPIAPAVSAMSFSPVPLPMAFTHTPSIIKPQPQRSRLQSLFNQLTTTSAPLLFREESLKQTSPKQRGYEFVARPTGETIVARRVDYR